MANSYKGKHRPTRTRYKRLKDNPGLPALKAPNPYIQTPLPIETNTDGLNNLHTPAVILPPEGDGAGSISLSENN